MRGTSQASRDVALKAFEPIVVAAGADAARLAHELYSVVDTLDSSGTLRRTLTDPARPGIEKGTLVSSLFHGLDQRVRDVVADFSGRRWWNEHDLGDALEDAAVEGLLVSAQAAGSLDTVEEELFRIERLLSSERDVYSALDNRSAIPAARKVLASSLFGSRVSSTTAVLIERACAAPRGRRLVKMVDYFQKAAAARRSKVIAHVTTAIELSEAQRDRLSERLQRDYGRDILVNVEVDPTIIGGVRVQVENEVVDGTISARLVDVRRRLVG